jgi:hypothetical protein
LKRHSDGIAHSVIVIDDVDNWFSVHALLVKAGACLSRRIPA